MLLVDEFLVEELLRELEDVFPEFLVLDRIGDVDVQPAELQFDLPDFELRLLSFQPS